MKSLFVLTLFLTFFITRFLAYRFHDLKGYGTKKEKSKTLTGFLRRKTGKDWHHFHMGFIILLLVIPLIILYGATLILTILLAIGISLILDQGVPIIYRKSNYFSRKNFIVAFLLHLAVGVVSSF